MKKLICKWFGHIKIYNFRKIHGEDVSIVYCQRCNSVLDEPYMSSLIGRKKEVIYELSVRDFIENNNDVLGKLGDGTKLTHKRESGYYKVIICHGIWTVAYWDGGDWYVTGGGLNGKPDISFDFIDENKIEFNK